MDSMFLWELFLDTGAPEIYLLYRSSLRQTKELSA